MNPSPQHPHQPLPHPQGMPPNPPGRRKRGCLIALAVLGVLLLLAAVLVVWTVTKAARNVTERERAQQTFEIGDCLEANADLTDFEGVACSSPRADLRVLERLPLGRQAECLATDGATHAVAQSEPEEIILCAGYVYADPAASINNIEPGECLLPLTPPDHPRRADCADPGALKVDGRVDDAPPPDVPTASETCAAAGYGYSQHMLHFGVKGVIAGEPEAHYRVACLSQP